MPLGPAPTTQMRTIWLCLKKWSTSHVPSEVSCEQEKLHYIKSLPVSKTNNCTPCSKEIVCQRNLCYGIETTHYSTVLETSLNQKLNTYIFLLFIKISLQLHVTTSRLRRDLKQRKFWLGKGQKCTVKNIQVQVKIKEKNGLVVKKQTSTHLALHLVPAGAEQQQHSGRRRRRTRRERRIPFRTSSTQELASKQKKKKKKRRRYQYNGLLSVRVARWAFFAIAIFVGLWIVNQSVFHLNLIRVCGFH